MQKTLSQVNGYPQRDRSETEWYGGVQTFMWMCVNGGVSRMVPKIGTAVCGTACTVVWEVGKRENRR